MAFLVTAFFVYNFGPSGNYMLNTILLEPGILKKLNYNDWNPKISENDRFVFDKIVYESNGQSTDVDLKTYEKIYRILKKDMSSKKMGVNGAIILLVSLSTLGQKALLPGRQLQKFFSKYSLQLIHIGWNCMKIGKGSILSSFYILKLKNKWKH